MLPTLFLHFSFIIPLPTSLLSHPPFPTAPYVSSSLLPTPLLSALFHTLLLRTFLPTFLFFSSPYFPTAHSPLLPPPLVLCSSASPIPTPYLTTPLLFYLHTPLNPWCLLFPTPQFVPTYCWLYCATATRLLLLPNLMFGISNLK